LTSFTPIVKQAIIGLSEKALLLIFLEYLAALVMASPELSLCFLLGWHTFPESWRSGFVKP
jgi:hypothetical protein